MQPRHFLSVVAAATLWGFGGVLATLLADHAGLHPLSIAMWRMLIAGGSLLGFLAVTRALRWRGLTAKMRRRIVLTAALTAAFEALFFTAITQASVGLATLVGIGSAPVCVAAFDWLTTRRMPARRTLVALGLALAGLTLLMGGSLDIGPSGTLGVVLALGAGAAFAGITVVNREAVPGLGPVELTAWAFAVGGVILVPAAFIPGLGAPADAHGWVLALAMGVLVTALSYVLFLIGLRTVPPFVATVVTLLEPLVATVVAAIVLAERLGPWGIAGGAVLGAAVILLRPQRDEPETIH